MCSRILVSADLLKMLREVPVREAARHCSCCCSARSPSDAEKPVWSDVITALSSSRVFRFFSIVAVATCASQEHANVSQGVPAHASAHDADTDSRCHCITSSGFFACASNARCQSTKGISSQRVDINPCSIKSPALSSACFFAS